MGILQITFLSIPVTYFRTVPFLCSFLPGRLPTLFFFLFLPISQCLLNLVTFYRKKTMRMRLTQEQLCGKIFMFSRVGSGFAVIQQSNFRFPTRDLCEAGFLSIHSTFTQAHLGKNHFLFWVKATKITWIFYVSINFLFVFPPWEFKNIFSQNP